MAITIQTYQNPYEINKESYWDGLLPCPHFCVSQTMVNGLKEVYSEMRNGQLTTVELLINELYNSWNSTSTYIKQYAYIDQIMQSISKNSLIFNDQIMNSLNSNKKNILDSIRLLFELGIKTENVKGEFLTKEQEYLILIYSEVIKQDHKGIFQLTSVEDEVKIDYAIDKALRTQKGFQNVDHSTLSGNTVVFHGIHQFSPLILKALEDIGKFRDIILLFNYQYEFSSVYQTWIDIYSCFDCDIEVSENKIYSPSLSEKKSYAGNMLGRSLAEVIAGSFKPKNLDFQDISIIEFNNETEFANYVSEKYEEGRNLIESNVNDDYAAILFNMNEHFYAAGGKTNEILKIYFPDHFGERHFLSYPIGQFFISITKMWDVDTNKLAIEDLNDILECLHSGIIIEKTPGELTASFYLVKEHIYRSKTISEMIESLNKLKKKLKKLQSEKSDIIAMHKRIQYYNISLEDLNTLIVALEELSNIADFFYAEFSKTGNSFKEFYKRINDFLNDQIVLKDEIDNEFSDLIKRLLERLNDIEDDLDITGSFECLKDTMNFYLKQKQTENTTKWIVRDFEQIDGDILKSTVQSPKKTYHFACLSDSYMNMSNDEYFSWPLNCDFFELAYEPLDWKYQVYYRSKIEIKNFKRYALIYGLMFNHASLKISYIKNQEDKENELYFLLRLLNIKVEKYNSIQDTNQVVSTVYKGFGIPEKKFNDYDVYRSRLCPKRFAYESVIEGGTRYKDPFLMLKYYEVLLLNGVSNALNGKKITNQLLDEIISKEDAKVARLFNFPLDSEKMDISSKVRKLIIEKGSKIDRSYMDKKEEFLYLKLTRGNNESENILKDALFKKIDNIQEELSHHRVIESHSTEKVDDRCQYCPNKELCLAFYITE